MKPANVETKAMVLAIHSICPEDASEAVAVLALALAFAVVGAGWDRRVLDAAMDVAFAQAKRAEAML